MPDWIISLKDLPSEGLDLEGRVLVRSDHLPADAVSGVQEGYLSVSLRHYRGGFSIQGSSECVLELTCSRCLESFAHPFDLSFRYILVREKTDDPGTYTVEGDRLDLLLLLEEMLQLEIPMKPLCKETCNGLCTVCGKNRNQAGCTCSEERLDPRWGALLKIKEET